MKKFLVSLTSVLLLGALLAGAASAANLTGAGATFPFPIYALWFDEYHKLHPDVRINYQANWGTGRRSGCFGIRAIRGRRIPSRGDRGDECFGASAVKPADRTVQVAPPLAL